MFPKVESDHFARIGRGKGGASFFGSSVGKGGHEQAFTRNHPLSC